MATFPAGVEWVPETRPAPDISLEDDEVGVIEWEYSTRAPGDWVISGPLPGGVGIGRQFDTWETAEKWARDKYGAKFKCHVPEAGVGNRWAFLIGRVV